MIHFLKPSLPGIDPLQRRCRVGVSSNASSANIQLP